MIKQIYIKNFKAYDEKRIDLYENNIFIGENDSGKSTILQALDAFFNADSLDKKFIRDINSDVEIGVLTSDNKFVKKVFKPKSFKPEIVKGNIQDLNGISFVYISPSTLDVKKIICDLAVAKTMSNISNDIKNQIICLMNEQINSIINSIDPEILVVGGDTSLLGNSNLKLESALKFEVSSNGIPIEGRGSGYQKNLLYSILTGSRYENVIIGIDEIENSLSLNNVKSLMSIIREKFDQTLITTHSVSVIKSVSHYEICPILSNGVSTVTELYISLGDADSIKYILVEGKTDVNWVKKAIDLLNLTDNFVIIGCGGCENIDSVKVELERKGFVCKVIKDGDTGHENSLSKDCIELYVPLNSYNNLFDKQSTTVPTDKDSFFNSLISEENGIGRQTIKRILSDEVFNFLELDNPLVQEIKILLQ